VDEVAEDEKPVGLPEMHSVESMVGDTISACEPGVCYSMAAPIESRMEERSMSLRESSDELYRYNKDILDVPAFLRKQMDGPMRKESKSLSFDDVHEERSVKTKTDIDTFWKSIDSSKYEKYVKLLNAWYVLHHRLPRKKSELTLAGFDTEIVQEFDEKQFRKEMLSFAIKLYIECDEHGDLDENFVKYMENKYYTKDGIIGKVSSFIKQVF
jgi:hypothetical protein